MGFDLEAAGRSSAATRGMRVQVQWPSVEFRPQVAYSVGFVISLTRGDLNDDGYPDLAFASDSPGGPSPRISMRLQDPAAPGTFLPEVILVENVTPSAVAAADLNGDGHIDLAFVSPFAVSVLLQDHAAPGTFLPKVDYVTGSGPADVAVGDLNGDGRLDLVVANSEAGTTSVLLQDPGARGTYLPKLDVATAANPRSVAVGDLDGDGRPDLAVANAGAGTVSVLLQSSAVLGAVLAKVDYPVGDGPWSVAIVDLNGDGRPDLVAAGANKVSVLLAAK